MYEWVDECLAAEQIKTWQDDFGPDDVVIDYFDTKFMPDEQAAGVATRIVNKTLGERVFAPAEVRQRGRTQSIKARVAHSFPIIAPLANDNATITKSYQGMKGSKWVVAVGMNLPPLIQYKQIESSFSFQYTFHCRLRFFVHWLYKFPLCFIGQSPHHDCQRTGRA